VVLGSALASLLGTSGKAGIGAAHERPGMPAIIAPTVAPRVRPDLLMSGGTARSRGAAGRAGLPST
jgi:hypothetical protein